MQVNNVARFAVLGGIGFALGGAISVLLISQPFAVPAGGAVGGASLGLALGDWRKTAILAGLGAVGLAAGALVALSAGALFNYSPVIIGGITGGMIGASLGTAFLDWRRMLILALAGGAGFSAGLLAGSLLRYFLPTVRGIGSIAVAGLIGGALLGATLGYLETRNTRRA